MISLMLVLLAAAIQAEVFKKEKVELGKKTCLCDFNIKIGDTCSGSAKCDKKCSGSGTVELGGCSFTLAVKKGKGKISKCSCEAPTAATLPVTTEPTTGSGSGETPVPMTGSGSGEIPVPITGSGSGETPVPITGSGSGGPPPPAGEGMQCLCKCNCPDGSGECDCDCNCPMTNKAVTCAPGFSKVCPMMGDMCPQDMDPICPHNAMSRMGGNAAEGMEKGCQCVPDFLISMVMMQPAGRMEAVDRAMTKATIQVGKKKCKCSYEMNAENCKKSKIVCDKKCSGKATGVELEDGDVMYMVDMAIKKGKVTIAKCDVDAPEPTGTGGGSTGSGSGNGEGGMGGMGSRCACVSKGMGGSGPIAPTLPPTGSGSEPAPPTGSGSEPAPPTGSGSGSERGPGAPWSLATQKAVKAKLYKIFSPHQSLALYKDMHDEGEASMDNGVEVLYNNETVLQKWESMPNSAKVLRLGFHGCFPKRENGVVVAACNGCVNTKNMYKRFYEHVADCSHDDNGVSEHNGLGPTLEILEKVYKDPAFPSRTPVLESSLFDVGISRADLWAFATITAVEYAIDMNNVMCTNSTHLEALDLDNYDYDSHTSSSHYHFNTHMGDDDCEIEKPAFIFTTGRTDCTPPGEGSDLPAYHTDMEEIHPDKQGSGPDTVNYFKDNFGLTGQETVALMGSHTLGMFNYPHNLLHYTWTSRTLELWNNDYYKLLALEDMHIYNAYPKKMGEPIIPIKAVGDAKGNKAKTKWRARVRKDNLKCGPAFWRHNYLSCFDCHAVNEGVKAHGMNDFDSSCCEVGDTGDQCVANPRDENGNILDGKCEKLKFSKDPETALNAELGLVFDFKVDENGYPYNCTGFDNFNFETIDAADDNGDTSTIPDCPRQMLAWPANDKPVSDYVSDYARDRALWMSDYTTVLAKMLATGYQEGDLKAKSPIAKLSCLTPKVNPIFPWNKAVIDLKQRCPQFRCWEEGEEGQGKIGSSGLFQLSPLKETRILTSGKAGVIRIDPAESVCTTRQLWKWEGDFLVNAKTGKPLTINGVGEWTITLKSDTDSTYYIKSVVTGSSEWLRIGNGVVELGKRQPWIFTEV